MRSNVFLILISIFFIILSTYAQNCYELIEEPSFNNIVLVIDKSGSMSGKPINHAKTGANNFVDAMKSDDFVSVIAFDEQIESISGFSNNKTKLKSSISSITTGGNTALYDAVAQAFSMLINKKGAKIIVFLTDGRDNNSNYSLSEIKKMSITKGIFVYGIGLGSVDETALRTLTSATNGEFEHTNNSKELEGLYSRILNNYYSKYGNKQKETGSITVKSIPGSRSVIFNGVKSGISPLKLDNMEPGNYSVEVEFEKGIAQCDFPVKAGFRTVLDLRESDLGKDVIIMSNLSNCNVFIDDEYVGSTSMRSVNMNPEDKFEDIGNINEQLKVNLLPLGEHIIRIKGIPDFEFGSDQEAKIKLRLVSEDESTIYIYIPLLSRNNEIHHNAKNIINITPKNNPFDEL